MGTALNISTTVRVKVNSSGHRAKYVSTNGAYVWIKNLWL